MKAILKTTLCTFICLIIAFSVCSCDTGTTDSVVVPEGTKNAVVIRYEVNTDKTVTATVSIEGDVEYAAVVGTLNYDKDILTYVSHEVVDCSNVNNKEAGVLAFSQADSKNFTENQTLFKVTFSYTEATTTKLSFTFNSGNFINDQFNDVEYTVIGEELTLS